MDDLLHDLLSSLMESEEQHCRRDIEVDQWASVVHLCAQQQHGEDRRVSIAYLQRNDVVSADLGVPGASLVECAHMISALSPAPPMATSQQQPPSAGVVYNTKDWVTDTSSDEQLTCDTQAATIRDLEQQLSAREEEIRTLRTALWARQQNDAQGSDGCEYDDVTGDRRSRPIGAVESGMGYMLGLFGMNGCGPAVVNHK